MKDESTIVTLDLSKELTPAELESFRKQAETCGRTIEEHLRDIVFGQRADEQKGAA